MTPSPTRGPSRRVAVWIAVVATLIGIAGIGVGVTLLVRAIEQGEDEGFAANDATIELARATAPVPSYWFGERSPDGFALDRIRPTLDPVAGTLRFSYGRDCPSATLGCTEQTLVHTSATRSLARLDGGDECWLRSGAAMVHWCERRPNGLPSREAHVFTADVMVRVRVGRDLPNAGQPAPAPRPWQELEPQLERFDRPDGRRFPPADPLSCSEYRTGDAGQRRALPAVLRPPGDC